MVVPEIDATRPRASASLRMSGTCSRESGRPRRAGSSQAIALIATTTSGGKDRGPAGARTLDKPEETLFEEALSPFGDDLPAGIEAPGDLVIAEAIGGQEDDLGADDLSIR